jgi:general secretion pathway protein E
MPPWTGSLVKLPGPKESWTKLGYAGSRTRMLFDVAGKIFFLGLVLVFGAATLFLIASREASHPPKWQDFLASLLQGQFALGPWILGGCAALALLSEGALFWLRRVRPSDAADPGPLRAKELRAVLEEIRARLGLLSEESGEGAIPRLLDELLRGALRLEASDIHISPAGGGSRVTYRVHGSLYPVVELDADRTRALGIRIKVLAQLETYGRKPQDGRLRHNVDAIPLEARVSALPADTGERIVLRLVRGTRTVPELKELGLTEAIAEKLGELLTKPQGVIFLSGPVGSGKTTTLYSSLQHIVEKRGQTTAIVSLEDPIELKLPFATQIQINPKLQMGFAQALRSVLRQDPNVIMIGEIRDKETAEIAMQAGMTGHLILTTIHVDSAPSTFARVIDMGVEPFVAGSASIACVSQRLVRTLCTHCRQLRAPDEILKKRLDQLNVELGDSAYYAAVGCSYCDGQGFSGRTPIAELLVVTPEIRKLVVDGKSPQEIEEAYVRAGGVRLLETGLGLARSGVTSLAEVVRVVG